MDKQTASRTAKTAQAEAKQKDVEEKRAARALAKTTKALAAEIDTLVADARKLADEADEAYGTTTRQVTEKLFRLTNYYGLTQLKVATLMHRSQPWVSKRLDWRANGYPATAFGPQSKEKRAKAKLLVAPNNPDPNVGMPPGPKLALMPDDTIARITGNDVDTEASAGARKALASETEPEDATAMPAPAPASAAAPEPLSPEEISNDLLSKAKKFWREQIAAGITDDDVKKYLGFISD
jgi:hypothetical protein